MIRETYDLLTRTIPELSLWPRPGGLRRQPVHQRRHRHCRLRGRTVPGPHRRGQHAGARVLCLPNDAAAEPGRFPSLYQGAARSHAGGMPGCDAPGPVRQRAARRALDCVCQHCQLLPQCDYPPVVGACSGKKIQCQQGGNGREFEGLVLGNGEAFVHFFLGTVGIGRVALRA